MQSKFIRILIIINGIIIPMVVLAIVYKLTEDYFRHYDFNPESILVGEKLDEAVAKKVALQGLHYEYPMSIYNSTNLYMPLSVMSYKEEKELKEMRLGVAPLPGDESFQDNERDFTDLANYSDVNYFNILFMDRGYKVIGKLVDRKAAISTMEIPGAYLQEEKQQKVDTTVRHIAYYIAFEDTNRDGMLNGKDNHDLYISDLSGKNLTQVTNNITIEDWDFLNNHSQILIIYRDRNKGERQEHEQKRFAIYDIATKKLSSLEDIHVNLEAIEKQLTHKK